MKDQITQNLNDPEKLEMLFRQDKSAFMRDFGEATSGIDTGLVRFWRIRLENSRSDQPSAALKKGLAVMAVIAVISALLTKLPMILPGLNPEEFYLRNLFLIIFSGLTGFILIKNKITGWKQILILAFPTLGLAIYLNLLPVNLTDTGILALIHAPVFMGFIFAVAFVSLEFRNTGKVSGFIRYCGELVIMTGLLAIAGAIFSGLTIGLFNVIGMDISEFYAENVAITGVAVLPVIAAWLIETYPGITDRIAPVIARVFAPLVLISAVIYLVTLFITGISLSQDRELLLIFNILLLCVMAIIVFSLSELDKSGVRKFNLILLFFLVVVTLLIDIFALNAIMTRLSEGFTPNRTVVLVSNILVLINLLLILPDLFLTGFKGKSTDRVKKIIYGYLPVYFLYCMIVIFVFPFIFGMK